jgi:hypothetical protein
MDNQITSIILGQHSRTLLKLQLLRHKQLLNKMRLKPSLRQTLVQMTSRSLTVLHLKDKSNHSLNHLLGHKHSNPKLTHLKQTQGHKTIKVEPATIQMLSLGNSLKQE